VLSLTVLLLAVMACDITASGDLGKVDIGQISGSPAEFEGKSVIIVGEYRGWQMEDGYGPPVTRSDWIVKDNTGWIYVTGGGSGLDPVADIGHPVVVKGTVRVSAEGMPYIEVKNGDVAKEGVK
jgi:hypothetical protein